MLSLSTRNSGATKCSITRGSAFMAANGARSSSRQDRRSRRAVFNSTLRAYSEEVSARSNRLCSLPRPVSKWCEEFSQGKV
jgi:hypothetical protein